MPVQHDPASAVNLLDRERTGEVVRVHPHPRRWRGSGRHALCGGIQRTQDLAHVPTWILHGRLDGFEPVALAVDAVRIMRVHDVWLGELLKRDWEKRQST